MRQAKFVILHDTSHKNEQASEMNHTLATTTQRAVNDHQCMQGCSSSNTWAALAGGSVFTSSADLHRTMLTPLSAAIMAPPPSSAAALYGTLSTQGAHHGLVDAHCRVQGQQHLPNLQLGGRQGEACR